MWCSVGNHARQLQFSFQINIKMIKKTFVYVESTMLKEKRIISDFHGILFSCWHA